MSQHYLNIELPEQQHRFLTTWKSPKVEHYFRLVFLVALVNIGYFIFSFGPGVFSTDVANLQALSYMVLGNFSVAILMRQQYVINLLFWLATRAPVTWPLAIRWHLGKVYHHGGLHSGCAVFGTIWLAVFSVVLALAYQPSSIVSELTLMTSYCLLVLLVLMILNFL